MSNRGVRATMVAHLLGHGILRVREWITPELTRGSIIAMCNQLGDGTASRGKGDDLAYLVANRETLERFAMRAEPGRPNRKRDGTIDEVKVYRFEDLTLAWGIQGPKKWAGHSTIHRRFAVDRWGRNVDLIDEAWAGEFETVWRAETPVSGHGNKRTSRNTDAGNLDV